MGQIKIKVTKTLRGPNLSADPGDEILVDENLSVLLTGLGAAELVAVDEPEVVDEVSVEEVKADEPEVVAEKPKKKAVK